MLTWPDDVAWEQDHEESRGAEDTAPEQLGAEAEPLVGAVVVEVHTQAVVDSSDVLLAEPALFPERPDGHDAGDALREVVDHGGLGDRVQTCQLARRRDVVAL